MDAPAPPPSDRLLERLKTLHPKLIDLTLDRVLCLLADLGHPERRLPRVIHVAGTNGKGSVVAYLRAALEATDARVHVYTSPHLVRFHERIRIAGRLIEEAALARLLDEVESVNAGRPITFFEVTTAAAFLAFARTPADWLVLEVGLGGRLDATNVVDPALSIVTPVSLDHQAFLGDTLAGIASEKAGILKRGVPAIVGPQPQEAAEAVAARARAVGAPVLWHGRDFDARPTGTGLRHDEGGVVLDLPRPVLVGRHQIDNAAIAIAALGRIGGDAASLTAIRAGLAGAEWPARLQRLAAGRLRERLGASAELWLDGGHNPDAGRMLAAHARESWADRPLDLVVGMMASKDAAGFLGPLAALARQAIAVPIPGEPGAFAPEVLAELGRGVGLSIEAARSTAAALDRLAGSGSRVLICGSLYLAGTVLAENG